MSSQVTPKNPNHHKYQQQHNDYFIPFRQLKKPQRIQSYCEVEVIQTNKSTSSKRTFNKFKIFNNDKSFSSASQKSNYSHNSHNSHKKIDDLQKVRITQKVNKKQNDLQIKFNDSEMQEMWKSFISNDFRKIDINDFEDQKLVNKTLQQKFIIEENNDMLKKYKSNENLLHYLNAQQLDKKIQQRTNKLKYQIKPNFTKKKNTKGTQITQSFKKQISKENLVTSPSQQSLQILQSENCQIRINSQPTEFDQITQPIFCCQCQKMKQKITKLEQKIAVTKSVAQQMKNLNQKFKHQAQNMQIYIAQTLMKAKQQFNNSLSTINSLTLISENGKTQNRIVHTYQYKYENKVQIQQQVPSYKLLDQAISQISKDIMRSLQLQFKINNSFRKDMAGRIIKNYIPNQLTRAFRSSLHQQVFQGQCGQIANLQNVKCENSPTKVVNILPSKEIQQPPQNQINFGSKDKNEKILITKTYSLLPLSTDQLRQMVIDSSPRKRKYSQCIRDVIDAKNNNILDNSEQQDVKTKSEYLQSSLKLSRSMQNLKKCLDNLKQLKHEEEQQFMSNNQ